MRFQAITREVAIEEAMKLKIGRERSDDHYFSAVVRQLFFILPGGFKK
jgi:hypothetical protein